MATGTKSATYDYNAFGETNEHEFKQDQLSRPQLKRIRWEMKRLQERFPGKSITEVTAIQLVDFLEIGMFSMKTFNNRRGVLSTFFQFAFQRGWIAENPIPKVPHHRIRVRGGILYVQYVLRWLRCYAKVSAWLEGLVIVDFNVTCFRF